MNVATLLGALASLVLAVALPVEAALAAGIQALNVPAQGSSAPLSGRFGTPVRQRHRRPWSARSLCP